MMMLGYSRCAILLALLRPALRRGARGHQQRRYTGWAKLNGANAVFHCGKGRFREF